MSILTAGFSEIIEDRKRRREEVASDRPTKQSKRLKWREIEDLNDDRELARLESNQIQIG